MKRTTPTTLTAVGTATALLLLAAVFTGLPQAASADSGHQKFTITTVGRQPGTVVAKGPISGEGTETNNHLDKQPGQPFESTLHFDGGDVFLQVTPGPPEVKFNPNTCVTRITESDTFVITRATGVYAGASGSGTSKLHVTIERARTETGACAGAETPPLSSFLIVRAKGTVSIPEPG